MSHCVCPLALSSPLPSHQESFRIFGEQEVVFPVSWLSVVVSGCPGFPLPCLRVREYEGTTFRVFAKCIPTLLFGFASKTGPFPIGKTETDADPLAWYGGIRNITRASSSKFNRQAHWLIHPQTHTRTTFQWSSRASAVLFYLPVLNLHRSPKSEPTRNAPVLLPLTSSSAAKAFMGPGRPFLTLSHALSRTLWTNNAVKS